MGGDDVTLISTTDGEAEVQAALAGKPADPPAPPAPPDPAAAAAAAAAAAGETPPAGETKPPAGDTKPPAGETPPPAADAKPPADETPEQKREREINQSATRRVEKIQGEIAVATKKREEAKSLAEAEEKRVADLKKEADELAAKIEAAKKQAEPPAPPVAAAPPERPKPKLDDKDANGAPKYKDYEEWVQDTVEWSKEDVARQLAKQRAEFDAQREADKKERDAKEQADRERVEREQAEKTANAALDGYRAKTDEFRKAHPDFDAKLEGIGGIVDEIREELGKGALGILDQFTVHDAADGPAVVYHFANNPDELRALVKLTGAQQLIALGKLEARLEAAKVGSASVVTPSTRAPQPIRPVGGGPTASTVPPEDEPYEDYKRRRNNEERARAGLPPLR